MNTSGNIGATSPGAAGAVADRPAIEDVGGGRIKYNGVEVSVLEAVTLLFVDRAKTYSSLVKDKITRAQGTLHDIKEARRFLGELRNKKSELKQNGHITIPPGLRAFCDKNGIKISGDDNKFGQEENDAAVQNIQAHIDNKQDSNQIEMLQLKSTVNNMDTSITGASKQVELVHSSSKDIVSGLGR